MPYAQPLISSLIRINHNLLGDFFDKCAKIIMLRGWHDEECICLPDNGAGMETFAANTDGLGEC
jgi:hypothetical protein